MEMSGSEFRDLLTFITPLDQLTTGYAGLLIFSTLLLLELTELQSIKLSQMFFQLRARIGGTGNEHACNGTDVVQTIDLRDKTGDLVD